LKDPSIHLVDSNILEANNSPIQKLIVMGERPGNSWEYLCDEMILILLMGATMNYI
jgi:hypothetical protein